MPCYLQYQRQTLDFNILGLHVLCNEHSHYKMHGLHTKPTCKSEGKKTTNLRF